MNFLKASALALIAIAHAMAFTYVWADVGAMTLFSSAISGWSFIYSSLAASFVTATITTAPSSLLAGFIGGRRFVALIVILLLAALVSFQLYALGLGSYIRSPSLFVSLSELGIVAILGIAFSLLGAHIKASRRAVA